MPLAPNWLLLISTPVANRTRDANDHQTANNALSREPRYQVSKRNSVADTAKVLNIYLLRSQGPNMYTSSAYKPYRLNFEGFGLNIMYKNVLAVK